MHLNIYYDNSKNQIISFNADMIVYNHTFILMYFFPKILANSQSMSKFKNNTKTLRPAALFTLHPNLKKKGRYVNTDVVLICFGGIL